MLLVNKIPYMYLTIVIFPFTSNKGYIDYASKRKSVPQRTSVWCVFLGKLKLNVCHSLSIFNKLETLETQAIVMFWFHISVHSYILNTNQIVWQQNWKLKTSIYIWNTCFLELKLTAPLRSCEHFLLCHMAGVRHMHFSLCNKENSYSPY